MWGGVGRCGEMRGDLGAVARSLEEEGLDAEAGRVAALERRVGEGAVRSLEAAAARACVPQDGRHAAVLQRLRGGGRVR